ncbi:MAG: hypothetical protein ACI9R8_000565 [Candidatus Paceibacteria bacterium]|jgi:hypothetical protein
MTRDLIKRYRPEIRAATNEVFCLNLYGTPSRTRPLFQPRHTDKVYCRGQKDRRKSHVAR